VGASSAVCVCYILCLRCPVQEVSAAFKQAVSAGGASARHFADLNTLHITQARCREWYAAYDKERRVKKAEKQKQKAVQATREEEKQNQGDSQQQGVDSTVASLQQKNKLHNTIASASASGSTSVLHNKELLSEMLAKGLDSDLDVNVDGKAEDELPEAFDTQAPIPKTYQYFNEEVELVQNPQEAIPNYLQQFNVLTDDGIQGLVAVQPQDLPTLVSLSDDDDDLDDLSDGEGGLMIYGFQRRTEVTKQLTTVGFGQTEVVTKTTISVANPTLRLALAERGDAGDIEVFNGAVTLKTQDVKQHAGLAGVVDEDELSDDEDSNRLLSAAQQQQQEEKNEAPRKVFAMSAQHTTVNTSSSASSSSSTSSTTTASSSSLQTASLQTSSSSSPSADAPPAQQNLSWRQRAWQEKQAKARLAQQSTTSQQQAKPMQLVTPTALQAQPQPQQQQQQHIPLRMRALMAKSGSTVQSTLNAARQMHMTQNDDKENQVTSTPHASIDLQTGSPSSSFSGSALDVPYHLRRSRNKRSTTSVFSDSGVSASGQDSSFSVLPPRDPSKPRAQTSSSGNTPAAAEHGSAGKVLWSKGDRLTLTDIPDEQEWGCVCAFPEPEGPITSLLIPAAAATATTGQEVTLSTSSTDAPLEVDTSEFDAGLQKTRTQRKAFTDQGKMYVKQGESKWGYDEESSPNATSGNKLSMKERVAAAKESTEDPRQALMRRNRAKRQQAACSAQTAGSTSTRAVGDDVELA
jgi:hypothetical protein